MGRCLAFNAELCVGCGICEETCSSTWFKQVDAAKSSIRVFGAPGESLLRATYCIQCGKCVDVCPTESLSVDRRGIVRLRKATCVGCLACVGFCPYSAMFYHQDQSEPFKCVACGQCAKACPADALAIVDEGAL
ncbi:MAG: 4Fe-4S binding protein [Chloroflexi bacterium]|nr:4Fe-4S binding protein [Chloroflexota bacterium]